MIVNQTRWARLRSAGASRRSRIVIAALIMFLASAALVLQPDWHVATSGLRVPGLHHPTKSSTPVAEPVPVPQTPLPEATDADVDVQAAVLSPDEDGILLSVGNPIFTSPNGRYTLALQPDGDLVLSYYQIDGTAHPLWWTGTGDRHSGGRTVAVEKHKGHVRLVVNAMLKNTWVTVWHSDLEPKCKNPGGIVQARDASLLEKTSSHLELSNDGKLTLAGVCDLRVPPSHHEKDRSLAVIVAGLYRTNHVTCKTHMEQLINDHPAFSRIDVFAYMLYEQADIDVHGRTPESIEAQLRECYGTHLRSVDVVPVAEAEEEYPGGKEAMFAPCGDRLRRLNNQLRTVSLAAQKWWAWTVTNGFTHDTVLRIRPDTSFWGRPEFKTLEEMGDALILPHPKGEHYFYCARMRGSVGVGPTDQIAYGTPASMQHWLYMHDRFAQMVDLASNPDRPALRDFSGCEDMPSGPLASDCPRPAPCSIECLVAWYLDARGVDFRIEWGWEQNPLRWKDIGMLGAEEERMADQHQEDKDDGMTWG
ncbi:hypothetical protein CkaCkLH20_02975 [Colletotrichum karsti]|uniref:Bulb-type lectin domain-containing protein n=1 Tax=Colletotrichum karsti TaxID=1095194 RepID=A0A9P6I9P2_9PEZI|nr:uncharacterized protein CkaCkLH20_02975 [Colletotrichum karsti]KAF9879432.1 hypothetical protein CkaCkLH20_02975 [Colletotrichum karsti]